MGLSSRYVIGSPVSGSRRCSPFRSPPSPCCRPVSTPVRWQTGRVCRPARRPGTSRSEECPALACAPPWHPGWNRSGGRRPFGASSPTKVLSDRPPTVRCRTAPRIHRQKSTVRSPSVVRPSCRWRLAVALPSPTLDGKRAGSKPPGTGSLRFYRGGFWNTLAPERTVNGRSADGQRTVNGRSGADMGCMVACSKGR